MIEAGRSAANLERVQAGLFTAEKDSLTPRKLFVVESLEDYVRFVQFVAPQSLEVREDLHYLLQRVTDLSGKTEWWEITLHKGAGEAPKILYRATWKKRRRDITGE